MRTDEEVEPSVPYLFNPSRGLMMSHHYTRTIDGTNKSDAEYCTCVISGYMLAFLFDVFFWIRKKKQKKKPFIPSL